MYIFLIWFLLKKLILGSTALIVLVEGTTLFVANVGDSRGVMCDKKGNAIPISFDHKPQQVIVFIVNKFVENEYIINL